MELFRKGDMSSWQLDAKDKENINSFYSDRLASYKKICFKETNNVIKQKEKYGYHLNKLISEYQRLRNINTIEHKAKVIQFSQKESEITSNYAKMMGNIVTIMENCVDNTNKEEIDIQNATSSMEINMGEDKNIQRNEIVENPNKITSDGFEDKKEEIRNEIIEEKKEHKIEEIKNEIKENEINNVKKEENVEEKKEEKEEEKKEEEKIEDKKEIKNEEKINEDKKEENDNVDRKEEIKEEKKEEKNEEKKEEE